MRLDVLDAGLLKHLQEDARLSFRELAEKLHSTTPTVSARVKALEELGIIRGYRVEIDSHIFGGNPRVVIARCRPAAAPRVAQALGAIAGVEVVEVLAGGTVLARLRGRAPHAAPADVHRALGALEEIESYDVREVLAVPHRQAPELDPEGIEVPCHQCQGPIHGTPVKARVGGRPHVFCCRHCHETFEARFSRHASETGEKSPAQRNRHPH